uniref:Uncharacterized protein n=1 Tax=Trichogramma kaykai TaxID=54128 RepID=A0ABD2WUW3_9HYME
MTTRERSYKATYHRIATNEDEVILFVDQRYSSTDSLLEEQQPDYDMRYKPFIYRVRLSRHATRRRVKSLETDKKIQHNCTGGEANTLEWRKKVHGCIHAREKNDVF